MFLVASIHTKIVETQESFFPQERNTAGHLQESSEFKQKLHRYSSFNHIYSTAEVPRLSQNQTYNYSRYYCFFLFTKSLEFGNWENPWKPISNLEIGPFIHPVKPIYIAQNTTFTIS